MWLHPSLKRLALSWLLALFFAHTTHAAFNFSAGEENFQRIVTSFPKTAETLHYRIAHEHRTLSAGTAQMEGDGLVRLEMALPELNPGVALPLTLTFQRGGVVLGTHKAWALAKIPPVNPARKIFLAGGTDGNTAEMLEKLPVEFETVQNAETLAALTHAFIIVEDIHLWAAALRAAEGGADVLLLTPCEVDQDVLPLPPRALQNFRTGSAREILRDKNAPYELSALEGGLRLAAQNNEVVLLLNQDEPTAEAAQWKYEGGGRVRVCGIPLIAASRLPTSLWLLAEMITSGEKPREEP